VGQEVGYAVRFEERTSRSTRITYLTGRWPTLHTASARGNELQAGLPWQSVVLSQFRWLQYGCRALRASAQVERHSKTGRLRAQAVCW